MIFPDKYKTKYEVIKIFRLFFFSLFFFFVRRKYRQICTFKRVHIVKKYYKLSFLNKYNYRLLKNISVIWYKETNLKRRKKNLLLTNHLRESFKRNSRNYYDYLYI